jgi:hypothetical protein
MKPFFLLLSCLTLLLISACRETALEDIGGPEITVLSPTAQATFSSGTTISLQVRLSDEDELHNYSFHVRDQQNEETVFSYDGHEHGQEALLEQTFSLTVAKETALRLDVWAEDHNGNADSLSVPFRLTP